MAKKSKTSAKSIASNPVAEAPVSAPVVDQVSESTTAPVIETPVVLEAPASLPAAIVPSVAGGGAGSRFKGIGTMAAHGIPPGLRRNEFQDRLLEWNETSGAHLTDDELAVLMDAEHPYGGVRITKRPELVNVIRTFYNKGAHGKQQQAVPEVQSLQYAKPQVRTRTA